MRHYLRKLSAVAIIPLVPVVLLAVVLTVGTLGFFTPAPASAATLVRGPYVQNVAVDSAFVCLEVDAKVAATVLYGTTPAYGSTAQAPQALNRQCVELTGLLPYTTYHYVVKADGASLSADATFKTLAGPQQASINFVAWGDNRTNYAIHRQVALKLKDANPDLVLNTGDLVEIGSRLSDWDLFFQAEQELLANAPFYTAIGNHEGNDPLYFSLLHLPGNERWYSFDSGLVHFVALDPVFSPYSPGSAQYTWLEQDLSQTTQPWKVVIMHYPPYSFSAIRPPNLVLRNALTPLFEKYGVQLVFNGHDHFYQRNVVNGVTYVVTGGGGAPLYPLASGPVTIYSEQTYHFVKVLVNGDTLTATGVRLDGTEFDQFTLGTLVPIPVVQPPNEQNEQTLVSLPALFQSADIAAPSSPAATSSSTRLASLSELLPFQASTLDQANCPRCHQPFRLENQELLADGWNVHRPVLVAGGATLGLGMMAAMMALVAPQLGARGRLLRRKLATVVNSLIVALFS